jgi:hypothetical protein
MLHGSRSARFVGLAIAVTAIATLVAAPRAIAETSGVRHRIDAQISIDPASALIRPGREWRGTINPSIRVSANSRESRFYGIVAPVFADVRLSSQVSVLVPQTKVWEETSCHQRRGMPKVTVVELRGAFEDAAERLDILSIVRRIGRHVPLDELTPGIKLADGRDEIGVFYALRAQTRDSRINVDLKIYVFDCAL